jgi:hypothetical protein
MKLPRGTQRYIAPDVGDVKLICSNIKTRTIMVSLMCDTPCSLEARTASVHQQARKRYHESTPPRRGLGSLERRS